jgi:hypothetical protein
MKCLNEWILCVKDCPWDFALFVSLEPQEDTKVHRGPIQLVNEEAG